MHQKIADFPSLRILGTKVDMIENLDVVSLVGRWIAQEHHQVHHVVNTGMHGIMEGYRDPEYRKILNAADVLAPDGILVLWIARLRGFRLRRSATGPDLMWNVNELAHKSGYKYFLYGDTAATLKTLAEKLSAEFPGLKVVGTHSPPFRPLTAEEDESEIEVINQAEPDVLWVGLGTPKQERWIADHRSRLNVPVVVGVGASFKFSTGIVNRAPRLLRDMGFEWMWRLIREPKRVWRRVLIDAPQFIGLVALELTGLKKYG